MTDFLSQMTQRAAERLSALSDIYEGESDVSHAQHVRLKRMELAETAKGRRLIYLDTNAWKCAADFQLGKPNLRPEMQYYGAMIQRAADSDLFAFPIGAPTYFELDAMKSDQTRAAINLLVDRLCKGLCIQPHTERLGTELDQVRSGLFPKREGLENFLCSPIELFGVPEISPTSGWPGIDPLAFNKALFDSLTQLPFSLLLEMGRDSIQAKWDNSIGIDELNAGKAKHQAMVPNLNSGIAIELEGIMAGWHEQNDVSFTAAELKMLVIRAMCHWHEHQGSRALPTLRTLASTYGLMRYDQQRKYHNGDPNDFMIAATALPTSSALFTDRALANLLGDKRISVRSYSNCEVVSGYQDMGRYLEQHL